VLAGILQPARVVQDPSGERVSSGGDQLSPSLVSFQESPLVGDESVKSRPSLWKAQQLSEEDRVEAGITTPVTWESDPQAMRSKERRSKANADRPSLALKGVAQQLNFTDGGDSALAKEGGDSRRIEEKELEGELFAEGSVVPELAAPISRAPRSKASPVAAARTSARGASSSATPILKKAIQRAVQKTPGMPKSVENFAILQKIPDAALLSVARDSCIVFPSAAGNPAPLLSMIRARELAQAELALARDRAAAEELKKKEEEKREAQHEELPTPISTSSPPVGSGGSRAKGLRQIKKKKIQKKATVVTRRVLTRQARGRTVVSQ
jgi:hypothetical protein